MPDIRLQEGTPSPGAEWRPRPMPQQKLMEVFRALLVRVGVDHTVATKFTLYGMRRTLPTGADALEFPEADADAIGDWHWQIVKRRGAAHERCVDRMAVLVQIGRTFYNSRCRTC